MELVDAYAHCGLSKYEPIERVRATMAAAGVSRAVLVQHLGEFDNSYIGSVAAGDPEHFAGVLLVDHQNAQAADALSHWAASGQFRGLRLPADALLDRPVLFSLASDLGLVIVLFTPLGIRPILAPLVQQLESAPLTRVVVSHLGNPRVHGAQVDEAAADVLELARFANVYVQLSGMKMSCPPPHAPLHPLIERVVAAFGASRIVWGSNYPALGAHDDYVADLRLLLEGRLPVPREAIPQIAGENPRRLWFDSA